MKWKQLIVAVSLFGAYGNIVAQDVKMPITIKPVGKQPLNAENKQSNATDKAIIRKSLNPDRLDFIGIPSAIKVSK